MFPIFRTATNSLKQASSSNKIQKATYVNVYMKWKKDPFFDSIGSIHATSDLKPLVALKNCIARDSNGCLPVSAVSKKGIQLDVPFKKVVRFMRMYPSVFEEFVGLQYNLPWFRLTQEAIRIDQEERRVYEECMPDLLFRLKKFVMMSREKALPLRIIKGVLWDLGLPDGVLEDPGLNLGEGFRVAEMEGGESGLAVCCEENQERVLSVLQVNAMRQGLCGGGWMEPVPFPYYPPKGLRLKREISGWLDEFQRLPYVSPYEEFSHLHPDSDVSEKRVVGVLHELLSLFVTNAVERKRLFCLKKYFGLPQKFHKVYERHVNIFYLSLQNKTCTAILKEAYNGTTIEKHPLDRVRKKYIKLMNVSKGILKQRRLKGRSIGKTRDSELIADQADEGSMKMEECAV